MKKKRKKNSLLFGLILIFILTILFFLFKPTTSPIGKFKRLLSNNNITNPNVLFITLDTTRADHIGCYGYDKVKTPNLDKLAEGGILFENCISPTPLTLPSHSSMMTGLFPTYHGVRVNGENTLSSKHETLAEIFSSQGYTCGAFISAFVLDGRWGLRQGFHIYDDYFDLTKQKTLDLGKIQRPANEMIDIALKWMEEKKGKPFFSWVHLYDPHMPYSPPEPFLSEYRHRGRTGLYDAEIAFMDNQIGRLINWLEDNQLKKNTIIVIMGDHGEGLGSHGELTHGYFIYEYAIRVPFIVVTPFKELKNIRVSSQVRIIDIFPTLLEMLNLQIPEKNQGESLLQMIFDPAAKREDLLAYSEAMSGNYQYNWSPHYSLRTNEYKYIDAPRAELYNLQKDPEESNNLIYRYPERAKELKKQLNEIMKKTSKGAPEPESADLDEETMRRLAALGYVGSGASKKRRDQNIPLPDLKDKLDIFNDISKAYDLQNNEKSEEAAKILEEIIIKDPNNPQAKLLLATCYMSLKDLKKAKEQLDIILKNDPENVKALVIQANIFMNEGRLDDVIAICNKTLSMDKQNVPALSLLCDIYMLKKEYQKAHSFIQKSVSIQPKLTRNQLKLGICLVGMKNYVESEKILTKIIEEYPKFPMANFHLGLLYEEQRMFEEAKDKYLKELANNEKHIPARFNYSKLIFKSDRKEYIKQMKKIVEVAPELPKGYLFLARGLLFEDVDLNHIHQLVQKGLSLAKESKLKALGYFLLADIYSRKNQLKKVQDALKKANHYKSIKEKKT